jgi:ketopantoate reductase
LLKEQGHQVTGLDRQAMVETIRKHGVKVTGIWGEHYSRLDEVESDAARHASMLQDIQRGRRTEIDTLNGAIVSLGRQYGVEVPVNEVITSLVKTKKTRARQS